MTSKPVYVQQRTGTVVDIATEIIGALCQTGETVGVAESLTAGGIMAALTSIPGASATFRGGVVPYTTPLKHQLLGVDADLIATEGVIHAEVAAQMAEGVRKITTCDGNVTTWGVGTTGVAGPSPQDKKSVGTVYIGIASPTGSQAWGPFNFPGSRDHIREATILETMTLLREAITVHHSPARDQPTP